MRIKELIKEKGTTITELSDKLGMTRESLSRIISGKPSLTTLEKIAEALGVEVWELLVSPTERLNNGSSVSITCPHCGKSITIKAE